MTIAITLAILLTLAAATLYAIRRAVLSARSTTNAKTESQALSTAIRNAPTPVVQSRVDELRARGRRGK